MISSYSYCLKSSPIKRALDQARKYLQKANLNSLECLWIGKLPSCVAEIILSATQVAPFAEYQMLLYLGTYICSCAQWISLISTAVISSPFRCGYHQSKAASMLWYMTWDTSNSWLEHSYIALKGPHEKDFACYTAKIPWKERGTKSSLEPIAVST